MLYSSETYTRRNTRLSTAAYYDSLFSGSFLAFRKKGNNMLARNIFEMNSKFNLFDVQNYSCDRLRDK